METAHILVVDHQVESCRQLRFLLALSGFQFVVARTVAEAENWLASLRHEVRRFDVMLVNNVEKKSEFIELFNLAQRFSERLAVLVVERCWKLADLPPNALSGGRHQVFSCCPEQVIDSLRDVVESKG